MSAVQHVIVTGSSYRHNPYPTAVVVKEMDDEMFQERTGMSDSEVDDELMKSSPPLREEEDVMMMPQTSSAFYHAELEDLMFFPYTSAPYKVMSRAMLSDCVRLFSGQLPYNMLAEAVAGMMNHLTGRSVVHVEKIVRWKDNKKSCGCFHIYVRREDVDAFLGVDQVALCEETGYWLAETEDQKEFLAKHCNYLKMHREARQPLMPYSLVTVQPASSDYHRPRHSGAKRRCAAAEGGAAQAGPYVFATHLDSMN